MAEEQTMTKQTVIRADELVWTPEAIRALRARLGLSQQAFSERLGVAVTTVSRWEQGHKSPVGHLQRVLDDLARKNS